MKMKTYIYIIIIYYKIISRKKLFAWNKYTFANDDILIWLWHCCIIRWRQHVYCDTWPVSGWRSAASVGKPRDFQRLLPLDTPLSGLGGSWRSTGGTRPAWLPTDEVRTPLAFPAKRLDGWNVRQTERSEEQNAWSSEQNLHSASAARWLLIRCV